MSVKQQKPTIAVLTHSVITPRAHTTARVNLGTWETDGTVQVIDYYYEGIFGGLGPYLTQRKAYCESLRKVKS